MIRIETDFLGRKINTLNNQGQASIEFLLTFAFGVGMTLLFVSLAVNLTRGYMVHYANFMAARTFLSHDVAGINDVSQSFVQAEQKAQDVFQRYPLGDFDVSAEFRVNKPLDYKALMTGTLATFKKKMTPYSLVGGSSEATFRSESFLLKEPVRLQCLQSVCSAMGISNCRDVMDITVFDNGC